MTIAIHVLFCLIIVGSAAWTSLILGTRFAGRSSWSTRASTSLICLFGSLWLLNELASTAQMFSLPNMTLAWIILASSAHLCFGSQDAFTWVRTDQIQAQRLLKENTMSWLGWLTMIAAAVLATRVVHGLILPPIETGHTLFPLSDAAQLVQTGGRHGTLPAQAWGAIVPQESTPLFLYSWTLLLDPSGALLPLSGLFVLLSLCTGLYSTARGMLQSRSSALRATLVLVTCPAVLSYCDQPDQINTSLTFFALALSLLVRIQTGHRNSLMVLLGISLGMLASQSPAWIPLGALCIIVSTYCVRRVIHTRRGRLLATVSLFLSLFVLGPRYVQHKAQTGQWTIQHDRVLDAPKVDMDGVRDSLFMGGLDHGDHLGLGPFAPMLALIGLFALFKVWGEDRSRAIQMLTIGGIVVQIILLWLAPAWIQILGNGAPERFFLVGYLLLILCALMHRSRWVLPVLEGGIATQLALSLPFGWGHADVDALKAWLPYLCSALIVASIWHALFSRRDAHKTALLGFTVGLLVPLVPLYQMRSEVHPQVIEDIEAGASYTTRPLSAAARGQVPLWNALSHQSSSRVAMYRGPLIAPHEILRMPLFGSKLQHHVIALPDIPALVLRNDETLTLSPDQETAMALWLKRLRAEGVDWLVYLGHPATRNAWLNQQSALVPVWVQPQMGHGLYQVRRDRLP